ncbi:hypothetical protein MMC07_003708 [Pseudocyphellaria aurata]|nr:hypothetical protein [Pseudocyphellaria aurata]
MPARSKKDSTSSTPNVSIARAPNHAKQLQGQKRYRNGQLKEPSNIRSDGKSERGENAVRNGKKVMSGLEEEVFALGGTMDDYELVEGAPSDSEMEGDDKRSVAASHKSLGRDLQQFVRELGIDNVDVQDTTQPSKLEHAQQEAHRLDQKKHLKSRRALTAPATIDKQPRSEENRPSSKAPSHFFFEPQSEWSLAILPALPTPSLNQIPLQLNLVDGIHQHAKSLLELENKNYSSRNKSASSAYHFYSTIMSSGTLSDKISALTLSVQESPVHNMKALENLLALAQKRSRGQAVEVLGALKDLLGSGALLPSDRKLRTFVSQPGLLSVFSERESWRPGDKLPAPLKEGHLVSWAFEDWLKSKYFEVLKVLEVWCNDEVVFARSKAVDYVYQLLKEKPEQEANLLRLLVNKLGDSDKKIASKTSYNILQLETAHPLMKPIIIASIESDILFRPGQSLHAKYYAIITLNQTVLSGKEGRVARKLLDIYFSMFIKLLERPTSEKLTASGVNATVLNSKGEVQRGGGVSGKKARLRSNSKKKGTNTDEELAEKMLSAVLTGVNRAIPYTTTDDEAFEKHMDTLFRVTHSSNFNTSIQALMLIQQLSASLPGSNDRFYRTLYESLLDPRLLTSSKQIFYLNLLFRALKADVNVKRVKAFSKRLLQVIAMHQASFACGTLYLLKEMKGVFASLQSFIDEPQEDESDEEENFQDVQEENGKSQRPNFSVDDTPGSAEPKTTKLSRGYDGRKRDPEYSNAERSCLWEITPLLLHFHPSVALFSSKLISHETMPPKPDLSLHTLIHFLDRFVYRNPKLSSGPRGSSVMQPIAGGDTGALLVSASSKASSREPVNSEAFWKLEEEKVGADEVFFHKYFRTMGRSKNESKKKKAKRKADDASDSEKDESEGEIWKALVDSRPELEGSNASDDDIDLEELDSTTEDVAIEEVDAWIQDDGGSEGENGTDVEAEVKSEVMEFEDDDGALLDSDDEVPSDLDKAFRSEQAPFDSKKASKLPEESKRAQKRRKFKNLPTFASAEDYAAMLDDNGDDGK